MKNILIVSASPRGKSGNSASIARFACSKLTNENMHSKVAYAFTEIHDMERFIEKMQAADILLFVLPVYQNSVPGLVMDLFEAIDENRNRLSNKVRKVYAIANCGFAERHAGECAIKTCEIFSRDCAMVFMGGFTVSPGTLINGRNLEETGGTYRKLMQAIGLLRKSIEDGHPLSRVALSLLEKPLILPWMYRIAGRLIQNSTIKKLTKERYYAKPLIH